MMFERNRIENNQDAATAAVIIELDDGHRTAGSVQFPRSKTLLEVLNGPTQFVEFAASESDGRTTMIAKSSIRSLRIVSAPSGRAAAAKLHIGADFDPYEVLGLARGADRSAIREAYRRLSMRYHPDRYLAADLPEEVVDYFEAMTRRINAAYELVSVEATEAESRSAQHQPPVYRKAKTAAHA
jgi:hypothetical protein